MGRWGGEEFLALLPNTTLAQATIAGEAVCAAISRAPVRVDNQDIQVSVSVGCASGVEGVAEALLSEADVALYQAKDSGRNCVRPRPLAARLVGAVPAFPFVSRSDAPI